LSRAPEPGFLAMMWGASALESGRRKQGMACFDVAPQTILSALDERPFLFFKWTIETLVNEWLCTKPAREVPGPNKRLNTRHLGAVAEAINLMNAYENSEDGVVLRRVNVIRETSRIIQRQVPWQRGFAHKASLFRASRLYRFELAEQFFLENFRLSLTAFWRAAFAFYAQAMQLPYLSRRMSLQDIGIGDSERDAALKKLTAPSLEEAKLATEKLRGTGGHPAYRPSILRSWPMIPSTRDGLLVAPLPELVIERGTTGLFYDLVSASGEIRRTIGDNFEAYCLDVLRGYLPSLAVVRATKYAGPTRKLVDSADLAVADGHGVQLIIECKARRASFEAKFNEGSPPLAGSAADEITKAILQIWRTAAHRRIGLLDWPSLSDDAVGVVLTLDTWMEFAAHQRDDILARAHVLASEDANIIALDRLPIAFANIDDAEFIVREGSDQDVLRTLRRASDRDRRGYILTSVLQESRLGPKPEKEDPFAADIDAMFEAIVSSKQRS